jgi:hypothetical protein
MKIKRLKKSDIIALEIGGPIGSDFMANSIDTHFIKPNQAKIFL